jgi:hypothetical protein
LENGNKRFNDVVIRPERLTFSAMRRLIKGLNLVQGDERQFIIDTISRPKRLKVGPNPDDRVWFHFIPHIYHGVRTRPQTINGIKFLPKQIIG